MSLPDKFAIASYYAATNWAHAVTFWVSIPDQCYFYTRGYYPAGNLYAPGGLVLPLQPENIVSVMKNHVNGDGYHEFGWRPVTNGKLPTTHQFHCNDNFECVFPKGTPVRFTGGLYCDPVTRDISKRDWKAIDMPAIFKTETWVRLKLTQEHLLWLEANYQAMSLSCIKAKLWADYAYQDMGSRSSLTKRRLNWLLKSTRSSIKETELEIRRAFNWWEEPARTPKRLIRQFVARRMRKYRDVSESTLRLFRLLGAASKLSIP